MKKRDLVAEFYRDRSAWNAGIRTRQVWRWRIVASNGRKVVCSGEAFASKGNAKRALHSFLSYDLAVQLDERTKA